MIERLQQVLTQIEQLPPEIQEEAAAQLEILIEAFAVEPETKAARDRKMGRSLAGVWRELAWDDEVEAFERMRHETQPTPPIEL